MSRQEDDEGKNEVSQLIEEAQVIREDPQEWAEQETGESVEEEEKEDDDSDDEEEEVVVEEGFGESMAGGKDERTKKNESNPAAWMNPPSPSGNKMASNKPASHKSARDIRLALAVGRVAQGWASNQETDGGQN